MDVCFFTCTVCSLFIFYFIAYRCSCCGDAYSPRIVFWIIPFFMYTYNFPFGIISIFQSILNIFNNLFFLYFPKYLVVSGSILLIPLAFLVLIFANASPYLLIVLLPIFLILLWSLLVYSQLFHFEFLSLCMIFLPPLRVSWFNNLATLRWYILYDVFCLLHKNVLTVLNHDIKMCPTAVDNLPF